MPQRGICLRENSGIYGLLSGVAIPLSSSCFGSASGEDLQRKNCVWDTLQQQTGGLSDPQQGDAPLFLARTKALPQKNLQAYSRGAEKLRCRTPRGFVAGNLAGSATACRNVRGQLGGLVRGCSGAMGTTVDGAVVWKRLHVTSLVMDLECSGRSLLPPECESHRTLRKVCWDTPLPLHNLGRPCGSGPSC